MTVELFPAIDLRGGRAVRLFQGDYDRETVYEKDPAAVAERFALDGARRLHVVDLDAARDGRAAHAPAVADIVERSGLLVQLGGGIRTDADIEAALALGVERVVVGTAAAENPDWFASAVDRHPGKIVAGVDVRDGLVATRGWLTSSGQSTEALIARLNDIGPAAVVFTEISRDGAMRGPDTGALRAVLSSSRIPVIASGGIASLDDLRTVAALADEGPLAGIIVGRAIYENAFAVSEALAAIAELGS